MPLGWFDASDIVWGLVPNSMTDQSSAVQVLVNAAAGGRINWPRADFRFKHVLLPHRGVSMRGIRAPYAVTSLGTRFLLPDGSDDCMFVSEGYENDVTWSNYGVDIDDIVFDGRKAFQTTPQPLLRLRSSGNRIGNGALFYASRGPAVEITCKSKNDVAVTNGIADHELSYRAVDCDGQGLLAKDANGKLADIFMRGIYVGKCGAANGVYGIDIERAAGVKLLGSQLFASGIGNVRMQGTGLTVIANNNIEGTYLTPVSSGSDMTDVLLESGGYATAVFESNEVWTNRASAGGHTWRMLRFAMTSLTRNRIGFNSFRSTNFVMDAWDYTGDINGRIRDFGQSYYNTIEPANTAQIERGSFT